MKFFISSLMIFGQLSIAGSETQQLTTELKEKYLNRDLGKTCQINPTVDYDHLRFIRQYYDECIRYLSKYDDLVENQKYEISDSAHYRDKEKNQKFESLDCSNENKTNNSSNPLDETLSRNVKEGCYSLYDLTNMQTEIKGQCEKIKNLRDVQEDTLVSGLFIDRAIKPNNRLDAIPVNNLIVKSEDGLSANLKNIPEVILPDQDSYAPIPNSGNGNSCKVSVKDFEKYALSKFQKPDSSGSVKKDRVLCDGQVEWIVSESGEFIDSCLTLTNDQYWAADSNIFTMYRKLFGVRKLKVICDNGYLRTENNKTYLDSFTYKSENEIHACPDLKLENNCPVNGREYKSYLKGEVVTSDLWPMKSIARNLPVSVNGGDIAVLKKINDYSHIVCMNSSKNIKFERKFKFICEPNTTDKKWNYLGFGRSTILDSNAKSSNTKSCQASNVNVSEAFDGSFIHGNYLNSKNNMIFIILENPKNRKIDLTTGPQFEMQHAQLEYKNQNTYTGQGLFNPNSCSEKVPYEIEITFSDNNKKADLKVIILETRCGYEKGQIVISQLTKN